MTRDRQQPPSPKSRRAERRPVRPAPIPQFSPTPNQPLKRQTPAQQPEAQQPTLPRVSPSASPRPVPSPRPPAPTSIPATVFSTPHRSTATQTPVPVQRQPEPQKDSVPTMGDRARSIYQSRWFGWSRSWAFWWTFAALATTGIGLFSAAVLLKLPALPNCPAIFWPTASASLRMYCAELAANKQTVDDLLEAIDLVNRLPEDHPLRPEINRLIEAWALDILNLADEQFNEGELDKAIATAKEIPPNTSAYADVEDQIAEWTEIWSKAEQIYAESEAALRKEDFRGAFSIANRLLQVSNTYWQTEKYNQLNNLITITRRDGAKLAQARDLQGGDIEDILKAIQLAREVKKESYVYGEAQTLIIELGREMLKRAEIALDNQDYSGAIAILNRIPDNISLGAESDDFLVLAQARSKAWQGTATALEEAILYAQRVRRGRPMYEKAQGLIRQWQLEIQDLALISTAKQIAQPSDVSRLQAAIAEAQRVPAGNPRWEEAQNLIADWTAMIEAIEDRPYLDRARQIAAAGDVNSLQAAINEASRIQSGRALSGEAQQLIGEWRDRLQRIQDQPVLDQARQLAQQGDLSGAIAIASRIQSGRSLSSEAQADIADWQAELDGQRYLQDAYRIAVNNTTGALVSAIQTADQVPSSSSSRAEANRMIEFWSRGLLAIAQQQATVDLRQAIATAEQIPASTGTYADAQQYVQQWQDQLKPVVLETVPLETYPSDSANSSTTP